MHALFGRAHKALPTIRIRIEAFMQPGSYIVPIALAIAGAAFWAVALVDVFQRAEWEFPERRPGTNDRLLWMSIVVLFSGIGAVVYYFMVMRPYPRRRR